MWGSPSISLELYAVGTPIIVGVIVAGTTLPTIVMIMDFCHTMPDFLEDINLLTRGGIEGVPTYPPTGNPARFDDVGPHVNGGDFAAHYGGKPPTVEPRKQCVGVLQHFLLIPHFGGFDQPIECNLRVHSNLPLFALCFPHACILQSISLFVKSTPHPPTATTPY